MSLQIRRLYEWLVDRLGLNRLPFRSVPYSYVTLEFWLGAIVAASFIWLGISGLLLLLYYDYVNPAETNRRLLESKPFFKPLLTSHLIAANIMILGAVAHMLRNFLVGAYKRPREILWIIGVLAGFMALQTAFFGYSAIGDKIAVEAINIGIGFVSSSFGEYTGKILASIAFDVGESTRYLRIIALHIIFAFTLGLLFILHFLLFEAHGIHPSPKETKWRNEPTTVDEKRSDMAPWFPVNLTYILVITFGVWGMIFILSAILQSIGWIHQLLYPLPIFEGTDVAEKARPMPPWFLVYAFKLFQLSFLYIPASLQEIIPALEGFRALPVFIASFIVPPLILTVIPFIARGRTTHPLDNMLATFILGLFLTYMVQLTVWGAITLSFHSVLTALTVFITPILVLIPGLRLLRVAWLDMNIKRDAIIFIASTIVAIILPFAALIATEGYRTEVGIGDAISGLLGVVIAGLYLGIVAFYTFRFESSSEQEYISGSVEVKSVPGILIAVAISELFLIVFTGILLALIDPLVEPILATSLIGLLLLSIYGLSYTLYRVITIDHKPYKGHGEELLPHSLVLAGLVVTILIAL
ncbi:MAG: cytochrome b N-terminal domain-containing protein [Acidilobaceae archaeon]